MPDDLMSFAILSTGLVNFIATIFVLPMIDRFGRKVLLVVPISIIIVDFIALTLFLTYQVIINLIMVYS
jgi:hypothetical protein